MLHFRTLSIAIALVALSFSLATVKATSTQHYGPYPSSSPDSGTCGNSWANDSYDRHFYVTANPDGSHLVVEQFKDGIFVTVAGPSPGSCPPTDQNPLTPGTVPNGANGPFDGTFSIPIDSGHGQTSSSPYCDAFLNTNDNCTTTTFINTHFTPCYPLTCTVTSFFFHYIATSNDCLSKRDWQNASPDLGGNKGDIRSGPPCVPPPCTESDGNGNFQGQQSGNFNSDNDGCQDGDQNQVSSSNIGDGKDFQSTSISTTSLDTVAHTVTITGLGTHGGVPVAFTFIALETGPTTPGWVSFTFSDGYTNAGTLTSGAIVLH